MCSARRSLRREQVAEHRPGSARGEDSVDHAIIDAVARAVATGASRRQVLRLLAMGTVIGWRPGRAGAVPARLACAARLTDCGTGCVDLWSDPFNCGGCGIACPNGVCEGGTCFPVHADIGCVLPTVMCGGLCADLRSDPNNCGACGTVCPAGICEGGTCSSVHADIGCVLPTVMCGGLCADLRSDPYHCGGCGIACASGVCEGGTCFPVHRNIG
jgi:hypothetical protein